MNEKPSTPSSASRAGAAVVGFLVGGAGGFVATEAFAAFCHFVLGVTLDVEDTPALLVVFAGLPPLLAVVGAILGVRIAARESGGDR
ncbi:hypothetical protein [Actinomadura rubrobrunea]|uniref:hypothetical protein n=1 Tax=Actinomadura rubrobrunea TaxID=115335 RepID=UPI0011B27314|nr:hypothetical protein [Actinomadura rubrobrunea]